jgi:phage terminase large subunit-like protein
MPAGRKSTYTPEIAALICERIAKGESLRKICEDDEAPSTFAVLKWLEKHPEFATHYARARELQADHYFDEIRDVTDQEPTTSKTFDEDGNVTSERVDAGEVQHRRLKVDALKWMASKLRPKKYGDLTQVQGEVAHRYVAMIPARTTNDPAEWAKRVHAERVASGELALPAPAIEPDPEPAPPYRNGTAMAGIELHPNPGPQTWALECPCDEIMYGGARGGGKGIFLILDWLRHADACCGSARGLLLRRYMPDLADFIRESKKYLPGLGWEFKEQAKEWHGPDGSVLTLRYLEREEDAERYQGWNLSWLAIDECGQFKTPYAIDLLRATLRLVGVAERVLRLTCNPGGPGHRWLKERYVDVAPPMTPITERLRLPSGITVESVRIFIPARLRDNPLCDTPEYQKNLILSAGGRSWLVKAWLEGDWSVAPDGGIFDPDKINFGQLPVIVPTGGIARPGESLIERVWQGWDTAYTLKTTNDECAGGTIGRCDRARFWLLDLEHGHWHTGMTPKNIMASRKRWNAMHVLLEGGPAGLAIEPVIRDLINSTMGTDDPQLFAFDLVSHLSDKVSKNAAFAYAVNQGQVWVGGTKDAPPAWWPYLRDQMLMFSGKDGIPDDCIDAFGVAFREMNRVLSARQTASPKGPDSRVIRADIASRLAVVRDRMPTPNAGDRPRTMFKR